MTQSFIRPLAAFLAVTAMNVLWVTTLAMHAA